jgi:transposase-like protein
MNRKLFEENFNFLLPDTLRREFLEEVEKHIPLPYIGVMVFCPDCGYYMMESPILVDGTREFVCSDCDKIIYEAKYTKSRRKSKYAVADNIIKLER